VSAGPGATASPFQMLGPAGVVCDGDVCAVPAPPAGGPTPEEAGAAPSRAAQPPVDDVPQVAAGA
jgi:hypothetical protein